MADYDDGPEFDHGRNPASRFVRALPFAIRVNATVRQPLHVPDSHFTAASSSEPATSVSEFTKLSRLGIEPIRPAGSNCGDEIYSRLTRPGWLAQPDPTQAPEGVRSTPLARAGPPSAPAIVSRRFTSSRARPLAQVQKRALGSIRKAGPTGSTRGIRCPSTGTNAAESRRADTVIRISDPSQWESPVGFARSSRSDGYTVLRGVLKPPQVESLTADVERVFAQYPPDVRDPGDRGRPDGARSATRCSTAVPSSSVPSAIRASSGPSSPSSARTATSSPILRGGSHRATTSTWAASGIPTPDRTSPEIPGSHGTRVSRTRSSPSRPTSSCGTARWKRGPPPSYPEATHPDGLHRSTSWPTNDLEWEGHSAVPVVARAGDVALFVSDIWHSRLPPGENDPGRMFIQCHYGRRDIAQRIRPTSSVNHLSEDALRTCKDAATADADRTPPAELLRRVNEHSLELQEDQNSYPWRIDRPSTLKNNRSAPRYSVAYRCSISRSQSCTKTNPSEATRVEAM